MFPSLSYEEFRSYVDFDVDVDGRLLRALWLHVAPSRDAIVEDFYRRILDHPSTARVLDDPSTVTRLMATLRVWLEELLTGPWDPAYIERRLRIGQVHVEVGVDHATMFVAMNAIQQRLLECATALPASELAATSAAIAKVTGLDLALMTGSYHNLLRERRARDMRALLITHMPASVLLVDGEGLVQATTPASELMFGQRLVTSTPLSTFLPPELKLGADLEHYRQRAASSGHEVNLPRVDLVIDGTTKHLSVTIVPFLHPEPGTIIHVEDHTLAVHNERQLRDREHLAQIGTMSATIAHEIRNPLAGIGGALQVIANGMDPDDRRAPIMQKILAQVRSLNRLVTDLLAFAKPDAARVTDGLDLAAAARRVVENVASDYPDVTLRVRGEGVVASDPDLVHQILLNLVINACQALKDGGTIEIVAEAHAVLVSDDGPGLPPEVLARIFEPFYTTKLKGTGLGLPISQKLARVVGASLSHEADGPLPGATFALRFERRE
jgi:signal transduction histidine kinase